MYASTWKSECARRSIPTFLKHLVNFEANLLEKMPLFFLNKTNFEKVHFTRDTRSGNNLALLFRFVQEFLKSVEVVKSYGHLKLGGKKKSKKSDLLLSIYTAFLLGEDYN